MIKYRIMDSKDIRSRERKILHASAVGIAANIALCAAKAVIGILSNSIAIVLDAVNNLSDALSSVLTFAGISLAGKPANRNHPFGFGRSYTHFEYGDLEVETLGADDYRIRCTVRNTGARDGEEVAQLYIRHLEAPLVQPVRELKAFERVAIPAGEAREVEFRLTPGDLQIIGRDYRPKSYEGRIRIEVGPSSAEHPLVDTLRVS